MVSTRSIVDKRGRRQDTKGVIAGLLLLGKWVRAMRRITHYHHP
jgi:hypothetical protein